MLANQSSFPAADVNQRWIKLTICPNGISKRVKKRLTMTYYLLSPISHICLTERGVKVSVSWAFHSHVWKCGDKACRYWKILWMKETSHAVKCFKCVLFFSFMLHLLNCFIFLQLFRETFSYRRKIKILWDSSIEAYRTKLLVAVVIHTKGHRKDR